MLYTFDSEENEERTGMSGGGPAGEQSAEPAEQNAADDNGCTYHSGRQTPPQGTDPAPENGDSGAYTPPTGGYPYGNPSGGATGGNPGGYPYGGRPPYNNGGRPPYNGGRPPYGGYPYGNGAPSGGKKGKGGVIVLIAALVLIVLVGLIGVIVGSRSFISGDPGSRPAEEHTVPTTTTGQGSEDGPSIDLAETPATDAQADVPAGENGYSAVRVYDIIKDSSVGILVYSNESGELTSEGSGVIIGENDSHNRTYIVTCAHVISGMGTNIKVMTGDDSTYDAQIVGYDKRTDLGVVMIKKTGLQSAQFAKVDGIRVGDPVYAIGNPGGSEFAGSFTNGMVSAIGRPVTSSTSYTTKCIQHTAAINPGNSGGALVNAFGQVIGVNSKKIVSTDYEGMGFAVPSDVVQEIANDLILHGYIPNRAKLGITYLPASSYEMYAMVVQLKEYPKGSIVIESITSDSNLRQQDVEKGDMVIAVNGKPLTDSDVLPNVMEQSKPGDKLTLTIVRISSSYTVKQFDVTVELIEDKLTVAEDEPEEETLFETLPDEQNPFAFDPFD